MKDTIDLLKSIWGYLKQTKKWWLIPLILLLLIIGLLIILSTTAPIPIFVYPLI